MYDGCAQIVLVHAVFFSTLTLNSLFLSGIADVLCER